ncbi:hypothetical protein IFM89_016572 [Coptis chinensis]|uniref:AAA+ ATPase domain-containing protein n=1 Tax=Coptis chinensis TaxID=261450 RepID=A0A835I2T8_9MAGN|nr:hypothetical protein IFM89_016572 [Coptis chinensis]
MNNTMLSSIAKNHSTKGILSTTGSAIAMAIMIRTISNELSPFGFNFKAFVVKNLRKLFNHFSSQITMVFEEYSDLTTNNIYVAAETYLGSKSLASTKRFKVCQDKNNKSYVFSMGKLEELVDVFEGIRFNWRYKSKETRFQITPTASDFDSNIKRRSELRCYELSFHKKHREMVLDSYLPHIKKAAKALEEENRVAKLHTMSSDGPTYYRSAWSSVNLNHPATFDKIAMDDRLKKMIMEDLERFVRRREYYKKVGKAWKRGYLLYGPPGTGKSSLIAAMANYLNFDIYDLELTDIQNNSRLRRLLLSTANRSILVVEDIDCSLDFQKTRPVTQEGKHGAPKHNDNHNPVCIFVTIALIFIFIPCIYLSSSFDKVTNFLWRWQQLTLSGMLNFVDGLWSSCGDERIIVFTTNNKDRLDPALLRPGRMDIHIHMSYCDPCGFRVLANNYLEVSNHPVFEVIERLLEITNVTPAEVAEALMRNDDPDTALGGLVTLLEEKHSGTA